MTERWHRLTRDEKARALSMARAEPDRPWADIARALGRPRRAIVYFLRRHCPPRPRGRPPRRPLPLADPTCLSCPRCLQPVPPLPEGAGYRCPCGHLIQPGAVQSRSA